MRTRVKISTLVVGIVAAVTFASALAPAEPTVRVAGTLRFGHTPSPRDRLVVDPSRHRGYYFTRSVEPTLWVLDLKRLRVIGRTRMSVPDGPFTVDPIRHQIFFAERATRDEPMTHGTCRTAVITILDAVAMALRHAHLPCDPRSGPVAVDAMSVDAPMSVLTVIGHRGSSTVVQEMAVRQGAISLTWEVEQPGLCAAHGDAHVARMRHGTAAYCSAGASGRAIWIPTWHGRPVPDALGRSIIRTTRTMGRAVASGLDRWSGRVAIAPGDGSVTVYDAPDERHVATILPSTGSESTQPSTAQRHAFDSASGRLYLLRARVLEAADLRADTDAQSARFDVPAGVLAAGPLAVDSKLHRIFLPATHGLLAMHDGRPALPPVRDARRDAPRGDVPYRAPFTRTVSAARTGATLRADAAPVAPDKARSLLDDPPLPTTVATWAGYARRGFQPAWVPFAILPFLVVRNKRARLLLRAPPADLA